MKSYAAKIRDSLTREDAVDDKPCCRRAELTGLLLACGVIAFLGGGETRVQFRSEHPGSVRRIVRLLKTEFSVMPSTRMTQASRLGGRTTFEVRLEAADSARVMRVCGLSAMQNTLPKQSLMRKCCRNALLRGVFLGCGTLIDPERGYLLEFVLESDGIAHALKRFLTAFMQVSTGLAERKGAFVVYVKDSDGILSVLSHIGAHGAILEFENVRILREARNRANRAANCDAANITKMLDASNRQMEAIARIEATIGIQALPDALRDIAVERRQHADASLEELGALLDPPVGKSGVYHRLRRIEAIARNLSTAQEEERR